MTTTLIRKLLRDVRLPLLIVLALLVAFECLWAKITQRVVEEILPTVLKTFTMDELVRILFRGPGQIIQTILGGEQVNLTRGLDVLTIGYVHPLVQAILCIWAVGRAAAAIAGEIDRGTMELLLAQPVARSRVILAHLGIDVIVIPLLCLSLWAGNWLGVALFGRVVMGASVAATTLQADPMVLLPALANVAALIFAVSGYTLWLSARGRFRYRVLGVAVLATLLQFLGNVIGQMWNAVEWLRPFTVFYYYQPQQIILQHRWTIDIGKAWHLDRPLTVNVIAVLAVVGAAGYGLALWTFCRRDLPAPL